jgi:UDP-N-acetylmuramoyl-tripeptide--D-alanyl-D-alanine ligase
MNLNTHPAWNNVTPIKKRGHLARTFFARQYAKLIPRSKFIGITGSVGKTTTALACRAVLSEKYQTISTTDNKVLNLDPIFSIPKTILRVRSKTKKVILEMGIEYPGEMDLYLNIVRPATAIVTRIFYAHSQFLGDVEEIVNEKGKLVEQLPKNGAAILNYDDLYTRKLAERTQAEVIYFGKDKENCHVWAGKMRIEDFRTVFELNYNVERVEVNSKLLGFHQIYALLAAAALGINEGIPLINIKKALEKLEPAPNRMQVIPGHNGCTILDDTYNSSPAAVEEALETLNHLKARRRIAVLGEMRELGQFSEKLHRDIARKIYKEKVDLVLLGGGDAQYIADELLHLGFIPERLHAGLSNTQIVAKLLKLVSRGDVVLVKASKDVRFSEIVQRIAKRKS